MESLKISTGQISLQILDDNGEPRGVFKFNPQDIESAKQFVRIKNELTDKQLEFDARSSVCNTEEERVELLSEIVDYFNDLIDKCFGSGSSEILFGGAKTLSMFADFFEGITPYYEKASNSRLSKYNKKSKK